MIYIMVLYVTLLFQKMKKKRVLHGWGHDKKYFVGSFNDPDGHSRNNL